MAKHQLLLKRGEHVAEVRTDAGISIAIEQSFTSQQPNHFETPDATRKPYEADGFVGDTSQGGSCNVDVLSLIPHCNGTHTETIGHIVSGDYFVSRRLLSGPLIAQLITVEAVSAAECQESYLPPFEEADQLITAMNLTNALESADLARTWGQPDALIIRTNPNGDDKTSREYRFSNPPAFFTNDALQVILKTGIRHLLVDLPSVDRMADQGKLSNHCLFWNVSVYNRVPNDEETLDKTITEMVYVPNSVADGVYLLDLQIAALNSDASPSRPILFPLAITN
ncbi:MAG: cyclase family protein [Pirellulaceae bacterium]